MGTCVGVYIHQNYLNQSIVFVRRGCPLLRVCLFALIASASAARADELQVFACIKQYTAIGISADAALAQCQKASVWLAESKNCSNPSSWQARSSLFPVKIPPQNLLREAI